MKVGQPVRYVDTKDAVHNAEVLSIIGSGESGAKMLNLSYGRDLIATSVLHEVDAAPGQDFWLLKGEKRIRDVAEEATPVEPIVDTTPSFPDVPNGAPSTGEVKPPRVVGPRSV